MNLWSTAIVYVEWQLSNRNDFEWNIYIYVFVDRQSVGFRGKVSSEIFEPCDNILIIRAEWTALTCSNTQIDHKLCGMSIKQESQRPDKSSRDGIKFRDGNILWVWITIIKNEGRADGICVSCYSLQMHSIIPASFVYGDLSHFSHRNKIKNTLSLCSVWLLNWLGQTEEPHKHTKISSTALPLGAI